MIKSKSEILTILEDHAEAVKAVIETLTDALHLSDYVTGEDYKKIMVMFSEKAEGLQHTTDQMVTYGIQAATNREQMEKDIAEDEEGN